MTDGTIKRVAAHLVMLACVVTVSAGFERRAGATDAPAPTAEERYEEGRRLMQQSRYAEAAAAYRDVAESEGAVPELRGQALFASGLMWESARDYERASATYDEVERRFPGSEAARRAAVSARELHTGSAGWLEFRRRQDEAWDQRDTAEALAERSGLSTARPALNRAADLLAKLLRDYGDHPKAKDIALALGYTHMTMQWFSDAVADFRHALALARADDEQGKQSHRNSNFILGAEEQLAEAIRRLRRQRLTWGAESVLGAIGLALVAVRPWRVVDKALWQLGGRFMLGTLLLATVAAAVSYYVRTYVDGFSPLSESATLGLVALPGVAGQAVALAFFNSVRGAPGASVRRRAALAATLGAIAALAVATCLVNALGLFPFLDSEL